MQLKTVSAITSAGANEIHVGKRIVGGAGNNALTISHAGFKLIDSKIEHHTGKGVVRDSSSTDAVLVNVDVVNVGAPTGQQSEASSGYNNIEAVGADGSRYHRIRCTAGSSGIYHLTSDRAGVTYLQCLDMKGPFPRGQAAQFNQCDDVHVADASCVNDPNNSWPEDVFSFYRCTNSDWIRCLADGNNSQAGVGFMMEGSVNCHGFRCDTTRQANGSWSVFSVEGVQAGTNCTYNDCVMNGNIVTDQGRGLPLSNGLIAAAYNSDLTGIEFNGMKWSNDADESTGVYYLDTYIDIADFTEEDVPVMDPIELVFAWEYAA